MERVHLSEFTNLCCEYYFLLDTLAFLVLLVSIKFNNDKCKYFQLLLCWVKYLVDAMFFIILLATLTSFMVFLVPLIIHYVLKVSPEYHSLFATFVSFVFFIFLLSTVIGVVVAVAMCKLNFCEEAQTSYKGMRFSRQYLICCNNKSYNSVINTEVMRLRGGSKATKGRKSSSKRGSPSPSRARSVARKKSMNEDEDPDPHCFLKKKRSSICFKKRKGSASSVKGKKPSVGNIRGKKGSRITIKDERGRNKAVKGKRSFSRSPSRSPIRTSSSSGRSRRRSRSRSRSGSRSGSRSMSSSAPSGKDEEPDISVSRCDVIVKRIKKPPTDSKKRRSTTESRDKRDGDKELGRKKDRDRISKKDADKRSDRYPRKDAGKDDTSISEKDSDTDADKDADKDKPLVKEIFCPIWSRRLAPKFGPRDPNVLIVTCPDCRGLLVDETKCNWDYLKKRTDASICKCPTTVPFIVPHSVDSGNKVDPHEKVKKWHSPAHSRPTSKTRENERKKEPCNIECEGICRTGGSAGQDGLAGQGGRDGKGEALVLYKRPRPFYNYQRGRKQRGDRKEPRDIDSKDHILDIQTDVVLRVNIPPKKNREPNDQDETSGLACLLDPKLLPMSFSEPSQVVRCGKWRHGTYTETVSTRQTIDSQELVKSMRYTKSLFKSESRKNLTGACDCSTKGRPSEIGINVDVDILSPMGRAAGRPVHMQLDNKLPKPKLPCDCVHCRSAMVPIGAPKAQDLDYKLRHAPSRCTPM